MWEVVHEHNKIYMLYNVAWHTYNNAESEVKLVEICRSKTIPDSEKIKIIGKFMARYQYSNHNVYDISCP